MIPEEVKAEIGQSAALLLQALLHFAVQNLGASEGSIKKVDFAPGTTYITRITLADSFREVKLEVVSNRDGGSKILLSKAFPLDETVNRIDKVRDSCRY